MSMSEHPASVDFDAIERETAAIDKNRADWITALRSGRYSQATGNLYLAPSLDNAPGFCCLGVGAHVLGSNIIKGDIEVGYTSNSSEDYVLVEDKYELTSMQKYYLMAMNDRGSVYHTVTGKRIRMNNLPQRDFKFIARWLEIYFALTRMPAPAKDK